MLPPVAADGGTFALLKDFLPRKAGITTSFVPIANLEAVAAAITEKTKVRGPLLGNLYTCGVGGQALLGRS